MPIPAASTSTSSSVAGVTRVNGVITSPLASPPAPVEDADDDDAGVISDDADAVLGGVEGSVSTPPTMRLSVAASSGSGVASAASPSDSFCSVSEDHSLSRG